jgi:hypothetical protein
MRQLYDFGEAVSFPEVMARATLVEPRQESTLTASTDSQPLVIHELFIFAQSRASKSMTGSWGCSYWPLTLH